MAVELFEQPKQGVVPGMIVRTSEGLRIGIVLRAQPDFFEVGPEEGAPVEHLFRHEQIANLGAGQLVLTVSFPDLEHRSVLPSPAGP